MKQTYKQKISSYFNKLKRSRSRKFSKPTKINTASTSKQTQDKRPKSVYKLRKNGKFISTILIVITIVFLILVLKTINILSKIQLQSYPSDEEIISEYWGGRDRINILVAGIDETSTGHIFVDRAVILNVSPDINKLGIFSVNTNLLTTLPDGQKHQIEDALIEGEKHDKPLEYMIEGIENLMGLKVDKYILINKDGAKEIFANYGFPEVEISENIVDVDFPTIESGEYKLTSIDLFNYLATEQGGEDQKMKRVVSLIKDSVIDMGSLQYILRVSKSSSLFSENIYTNISKREFFNLFLFFRNVRSDQIKIAYTQEASAYFINSDEWEPIYASIDKDLQVVTVNTDVLLEQAKVEVFNSTVTPGVASVKARLLENTGFRIVRVGNVSQEFGENIIYVENPDLYPVTIKEITFAFEGNIKIKKEKFPLRHIGDIVIVIGD